MSLDIEVLKKKIIYQSSYRGTKEMDILLRSFVKNYIDKLTNKELEDLLDLLKVDDDSLYKFKQGIQSNSKVKINRITIIFKNFSLKN